MTHADFLQAILADPDDDTPRLIYADWLEEQGDPRGEFIRVQCALAKMDKDDPRYAKLHEKENKLLKQFRNDGVGSLPRGIKNWVHRRGFIEEFAINIGSFLKQSKAIFEKTPVRRVILTGTGDKNTVGLGQCEDLRRLSGMELQKNQFGDARLHPILSTSHLCNLDYLKVYYNEMGLEAVAALCKNNALSGLRTLNLFSNEIPDSAIDAITSSPIMSRLTHLNVGSNPVSDSTLRALASSPFVTRLEHFSMFCSGRQTIGPDGVGVMCRSENFKNLATLAITFTQRAPECARLISHSRNFQVLTRLELDSQITDVGLRELAASPWLLKLEVLLLGHNRISDRGIAYLADSPLLGRLKKLNLPGNAITIRGVESLTNSTFWNPRISLNLRANHISPAQIRQLQDRFGKRFGGFADS